MASFRGALTRALETVSRRISCASTRCQAARWQLSLSERAKASTNKKPMLPLLGAGMRSLALACVYRDVRRRGELVLVQRFRWNIAREFEWRTGMVYGQRPRTHAVLVGVLDVPDSFVDEIIDGDDDAAADAPLICPLVYDDRSLVRLRLDDPRARYWLRHFSHIAH